MNKKIFQLTSFAALMNSVFISNNATATPPSPPLWSATVKNETNVRLDCQVIDYSHYNTPRRYQPCVSTSGWVDSSSTVNFALPTSQCPTFNDRWSLTPNISQIGIDCVVHNTGQCYQLVMNVQSGSTITMNCPPSSMQKRNIVKGGAQGKVSPPVKDNK